MLQPGWSSRWRTSQLPPLPQSVDAGWPGTFVLLLAASIEGECAKVYMEPSALGNEPLIQLVLRTSMQSLRCAGPRYANYPRSWAERLPSTFKQDAGSGVCQPGAFCAGLRQEMADKLKELMLVDAPGTNRTELLCCALWAG